MAYVDDWGDTSKEERERLMTRCERDGGACRHVLYRHGDTRHGYNNRFVGHDAGPCRLCKCPGFQAEKGITTDDVLDAATALGGDTKIVRLMDFGIEPFGVVCGSLVVRWVGVTKQESWCVKDKGHAGEHEYGWEPPK